MTPQEKMQLQETLDDFAYQLAELGRKIHLASGVSGAVKSYDPKTHTATIDIGYETHAMPVGDNEGDFSPLRVGQLVHVYAPSGDLANAFVKPAGYSGSATPPATAAGEKVMSLPGGGVFRSKDGKVAHIEAGSLSSLKLVLGGTTYTIKPEALQSS
jgi:phage baseplate assembly protein gpV